MAQTFINFADASGYERFMGRWSRAVAAHFLRWIKPPRDAKWLDVGCGGGILTEALLDLCQPAMVIGVDSSHAQVQQAARGPAGTRAKFQQADAMRLPFPGGSFDIVASALVINFIPDPLRGLEEMLRVTAPGGMVAAYVWDFSRELSPSGPLRQAMRAFGAEVPAIPGAVHSSLPALETLFAHAGMDWIRATTIDVTLGYEDFEDFWEAQTPGYSPTTKIINSMTDIERSRLKREVRGALPIGPNGRVEYASRANFIQASVPA
jgi:ubiquinone/menaquinone biosynthesis C-methylase UbiE